MHVRFYKPRHQNLVFQAAIYAARSTLLDLAVRTALLDQYSLLYYTVRIMLLAIVLGLYA